VLEKGTVADAIRRFPTQMTFFSTSEMLEIGDIPFLSGASRPTRVEAVKYYQSVARAFRLDIRAGREATSVRPTRTGFEVTDATGEEWSCAAVVVSTGYFDTPHPFHVKGSELPKVRRAYDEPFAYTGKEVALVGGRNSVVDAALDLYRAGARVSIIHRGQTFSEGVKYWLLPDINNRIASGAINAYFNRTVREIRPGSILLAGGEGEEIANDVVWVMIGYTIDSGLLERAGVHIDPVTMAPQHDPVTFETNVPALYVAGSIAAGKLNNKIFIENGRLHGEAIVQSILATKSG
jgi:thioredoxin reductase (NADPH)